jgi:hypothetical protein
MNKFLNNISAEIKPELMCALVAGSHLYQMETGDSDTDYRIIFKATNPIYVYGLKGAGTVCTTSDEEDAAKYEFRHFMGLMRKTNTQMAEILFAKDESLIFCSEDFRRVRENRFRLLDSEKLFKSLCGYLQNERRLAMGERVGQLGGKRKEALNKWGFSPKNCSHFIRLSAVGCGLFLEGDYTVGMKNHPLFDLLMNIKLNPGEFSKESLSDLLDKHEQLLLDAYAGRKFNFTFDDELAGELLKQAYH